MKPLITALVDTYNHERYIEQALVSVLEQGLSESELEIVVVDDGSTDKTSSIIQKFAPRVKHLRKENGGQASAFNAGYSQSHGEIIAPLDGDDWWAKGKLAAVIEAFEQNPEISAVSHGYYKYYEETQELEFCGPSETLLMNLTTPEAARACGPNWKFLPTGALTVRRKVMERVIPIPESLVFSADSPIAAASMAMGVLVLSSPPLFNYRFHSRNLYSGIEGNMQKLRKRYEIDDLACSVVWPMLLRLGVPEECVSALLEWFWISVNQESLKTFDGSRWKTYRTEMRSFRMDYKNPTLAYCLYKYLVMGPATLLLPPRQFYKLRDWHEQHNLGRFFDWIGKTRGSMAPRQLPMQKKDPSDR